MINGVVGTEDEASGTVLKYRSLTILQGEPMRGKEGEEESHGGNSSANPDIWEENVGW